MLDIPATAAPAVWGGAIEQRDYAPEVSVSEIRCNVNLLRKGLWLVAICVIALGVLREIAVPLIGLDTPLQDLRHFSFDAEHSLPVWYESLVMAIASVLLVVSALLSRHRDRENTKHWIVLAVIFILFSVDEAIAVHEVTITPLREAFGFSGFLYFSWVVIAAPILVLVGGFFVPFLLRLPSRFGMRFALAGIIFVSGAFGLELVGGHFVSAEGFASLSYRVTAVTEECLEIIGLTFFVSELMKLIAMRARSLTLRFASSI